LHIIITDAWLARSQALHLNGWKLIGVALLTSLALMLGSVATYHWVFGEGVRQGWPGFSPVTRILTQDSSNSKEIYMRENLDAMARKLGEMQARLMQIDSLGERLGGLTGLKPQENRSNPLPSSGGILVNARSLTMEELQGELAALDQRSSSKIDWLTAVESRLFDLKIQKSMVPTEEPVKGGRIGSPFGYRIDPITGHSALHTGLDFPADTGTPILAAAGGVVVVQEFHPAYGNMIEIDHGNDLITRYAHASVVVVKKGDIVKRGQLVAKVGSTGRSTGPHLHFEVLASGVPQDPRPFLNAGEALATASAGGRR
jgi:murein DD-endopeptidase MepM/ murein hydrolase activator NlpD